LDLGGGPLIDLAAEAGAFLADLGLLIAPGLLLDLDCYYYYCFCICISCFC